MIAKTQRREGAKGLGLVAAASALPKTSRLRAFASSRSLLIVFLSLSTAVLAAPARADTPPSGWDRAREPWESDAWRLHLRVQGLLYEQIPEDILGRARRDARQLRALAALELLEKADAGKSRDVRLRFDLGTVTYELADLTARLDLYEKAAKILSAAIDGAPDSPAVTEALERLVYCYAKLDRPREELATWHRYIPRLLDPRTRANAEMNMGEAEMRLGQVEDALATFHEVLREVGELPNTGSASSTYVLTLWDVAVALDRSGDGRGALDMASKAASETAIDSRGMQVLGRALIAHDPAVFFVPDWERFWYLGLCHAALAREATDAHDRWAYWAESEHEWGEYVAGATSGKEKDRWVAIARMRLQHAHAERLAAEKRVPRGSARMPPRDEQ
jgi:tetratricopeptide (TPR) repeat protein